MKEKGLSHALSWVLRHKAVDLGLHMDRSGFVPLAEVLAVPRVARTGATREDVERVVAECRKQRFAMRGDGAIRANQGHSGRVAALLSDEEMLEEVERAECCVHGTYWKAWEAGIRAKGLSRMRRRHVHFSSRPFGDADIVSGMRGDCQVLVHVDVAAARAAGIRFFRSANGVLLTEGNADGFVPPSLFSRVEAVGPGRVPRAMRVGPPAERLYVALDFEATCDGKGSGFDLTKQEIIEVPLVAVLATASGGEEVGEYHSYARPRVNPRLSRFCTELTGIQQKTVDAAPDFAEAWRGAIEFVASLERRHGCRAVCVTCGDWDLKTALPRQLGLVGGHGRDSPAPFRRWVNIKAAVADWGGAGERRPRGGLDGVVRALGLRFEGRPHSGIDDTRNVASAVRKLLARGYPLDVFSEL